MFPGNSRNAMICFSNFIYEFSLKEMQPNFFPKVLYVFKRLLNIYKTGYLLAAEVHFKISNLRCKKSGTFALDQ